MQLKINDTIFTYNNDNYITRKETNKEGYYRNVMYQLAKYPNSDDAYYVAVEDDYEEINDIGKCIKVKTEITDIDNYKYIVETLISDSTGVDRKISMCNGLPPVAEKIEFM